MIECLTPNSSRRGEYSKLRPSAVGIAVSKRHDSWSECLIPSLSLEANMQVSSEKYSDAVRMLYGCSRNTGVELDGRCIDLALPSCAQPTRVARKPIQDIYLPNK